MKRTTLLAAACAVCCAVCIPALTPGHGAAWAQSPCPTRTPAPTPTIAQAEIVNSTASARPGDPFQSTFRLNREIAQPFTAYAVVVMPDRTMLDALTLGPTIKPVASNIQSLPALFQYPLLSLIIPAGAPLGAYEVLAGFFTPGQPVTKPEDAFVLARGPFSIVAVIPTPTPTPIPDISGPWAGTYKVTAPPLCVGRNGNWTACVQMAPDGTLSGYFMTDDTPSIEGDIEGTYSGDTATWTVQGTTSLTYTGTVQENGRKLSGTFANGPPCPPPTGTPVSGTFSGVIL